MPKITPNYMEMKATDLGASKAFYEKAFGFDFTDYGPEYAAVEGGPVEIGLATGNEPPAPMPTFETDDLEAALAQVKAAQGEIVKELPGCVKTVYSPCGYGGSSNWPICGHDEESHPKAMGERMKRRMGALE